MSSKNRFAELSTHAAEKAARSILNQLSERLNFTKYQSSKDRDLECMQFGICAYQAQPQKITH